MKTPVNIAVTGAAGQISYSLVFRLASGELLGQDQPINLHLLEITPALAALAGVVMELDDCAYPLLHRVVATDQATTAFKDVDYAFLIGARPRGKGMERRDLLLANAEIFTAQGKALNEVASRRAKVLVVGNPANTNALLAMNCAPDLDNSCFSAMTRLDHNRAIAQLAQKTGVSVFEVQKVIVWGNHSASQYPDLHHAKIQGKPALDLLDNTWFADDFIPAVQQRGSAIINARGQSSAASAANAALQHMRTWIFGTNPGDWTSMVVPSDGSYGISRGIMYSFPIQVAASKASIVQNLDINEFSLSRMRISEQELLAEKADISHLL